MNPERWQRIDALFHEALAREEGERATFLEEACGADEELRRQVEALLRGEAEAGARLDRPHEVLASALLGEATPLAVGQSVGGYRLVRELGRGGMGVVFLAEREDLGTPVALKVLRDAFASATQVSRFVREQRLLARLEHPHIARFMDAGVTEEGLAYLVMEYVRGLPIDRYCAAHGLGLDERLRLFTDACRGVDFAHRNLVIHRDLKPANILVTEPGPGAEEGGQVKLLDFGIARALDPDSEDGETLTATGMRAMTPAYASPELVCGRALSTASDVYSLGIVLYELLAGRRPYSVEGRTPSEVERLITTADPPPPSARVRAASSAGDPPRRLAERLRRRLRGDLDTIALAALRKEPERRYASAGRLADELDRYLAGRPVEARPDTLRYRLGKLVLRHRWGVLTGATVLLLLLAYAVTVTLQSRRIERERARAELALARATRVSRFLVDMYSAGDPFAPEAARLREMTVPEFLKGRAGQILELDDEPRVQALLMRTVGEMYKSLGLHAEARPLLERALELQRSDAAEPVELARSLMAVGTLEFRRHENEAAEAHLREALALFRSASDADGAASARESLGDLLRQKGELEEARALLEEAVSYRRGEGGRPLARALNDLALVLRRQGELPEAERLLEQALALNREHVGPRHAAVGVNLSNLALVQRQQGRLAEAERSARAALALRRELLGPRHWRNASTLAGLSLVLFDAGRLDEAVEAQREAVGIFEDHYGETHSETLRVRSFLAELLAARGDDEEAERLCRELLERFGDQEAPDEAQIARVQLALAVVLDRRGGLAEAETLAEAALDSRLDRRGPDHWRVAEARSVLGLLATSRGDYGEAEALLLGSHAALAERGERDARYERQTRQRLVRLYEAWGRPAEAARFR